MLTKRTSWGVGFSSACAFLLGSLSLIVSSGYSYGPGLFLIASFGLLAYKPAWPALGREDKLLIAVLALFMLVWVGEVLLTGQRSRELDKPSRFLAGILVLLWVLKFPPKAMFVWSGLVVGALGAASLALWERFVEGAPRASGFNHPIQFGNISMLLGLLCISGLGWAFSQRKRNLWVAFLLFGFVGGFLASILSGSRGGWVGLPFVLLVLYRCYKPWLKLVHVMALVVVAGILVATAYLVPQTGVQSRVSAAIEDLQKYRSGDSGTSVGGRLEMWKGAALMIGEKPLTGWGSHGYVDQMEVLSDQGEVDPFVTQFDHAHNEFLDVFAKRGILGFVSLLLLYFLPLGMFLRQTGRENLRVNAIAAGGALVCVSYIDFSLSQSSLSHNSGVMIFTFYLIIFWSMIRQEKTNITEG